MKILSKNRSKDNRKILVVIIAIILMVLFLNTEVFASDWNDAGNVRLNQAGTELQFTPSYQQQMGYNYGNKVFYKNFWKGQYGSFMPFTSGETQAYNQLKSMKENSTNIYGQGGEHLVYPNDWNLKKGRKDPTKWGATSYMGDGTGTLLYGPNGLSNVEIRYLGYVMDGSVFDNPFFPSDIYAGVPPANKTWLPFNNPAAHQKRWYNDTGNSIPGTGKSYAQVTIEKFFLTETGATFKAKNPSWEYWNQYLEVLSDITESAGVLKGYHKTSNGRIYYQMFVVPGEPESNVWMKSMELIEKDTGTVVGYFKREIDKKDPMNIQKMKITQTGPDVVIKKGKTYTIKAVMQYLNLESGADRDISKPNSYDENITAKTTPITMDDLFAYDETRSSVLRTK